MDMGVDMVQTQVDIVWILVWIWYGYSCGYFMDMIKIQMWKWYGYKCGYGRDRGMDMV